MKYRKTSIQAILATTLFYCTIAGYAEERSYTRSIADGIELAVHEEREEDGSYYVNRIDVIENGVVTNTEHLEGDISLDDSMRYLALYPCKGRFWCSSRVQLFELPEFTELEPITAPDGSVILKMAWHGTELRLKYGTGFRKDSKTISVDVASRKTLDNAKKASTP